MSTPTKGGSRGEFKIVVKFCTGDKGIVHYKGHNLGENQSPKFKFPVVHKSQDTPHTHMNGVGVGISRTSPWKAYLKFGSVVTAV